VAVPPTDDELNAYIMTRFALMEIDISVLPKDDPTAPMDQTRVLSSARSTIRQDVEIAAYLTDQQADLAVLYPAPFARWTGVYPGGK
jgi:hypothetical protein